MFYDPISIHPARPAATLASIVASCLVLGCVADPKSIGEQETETDGSASDASADESASGSESGSALACSDHLDQASCEAHGDAADPDRPCGWVEVQRVTYESDVCGFVNDPVGRCIGRFYAGDAGCFSLCEDGGSVGAYVRPLGEGEAEVFLTEDCPGVTYEGFQHCFVGGSGADRACECMCGGTGGAALPPGFELEMTVQGGCADLTVHASNPVDGLGMILRIDQGLVDAALDGGQILEAQVPAADFDRFELRVGENVTHDVCTDVIDDSVRIDAQWAAVSGTVDITIDPTDPDVPRATLVLTDIVFEPTSDGVEDATIPTYTFTDIHVGWLPG